MFTKFATEATLIPTHTMRLVLHSSFRIYRLVNYLFGFSVIAHKNSMTQITQCERALSDPLE